MDISNERKYIPAFLTPNESKESAWFLVYNNKKLLMKKEGDKYYIPTILELDRILVEHGNGEYIGLYGEYDCFSISLKELPELEEKYELVDVKEITILTGDPALFILAGAANHILHWSSMNQYCGCCGHKTMDKVDERAKICPNCGNVIYPRISPATITAIFKGDQILLAHNRNFRKDLHSLIAGYVEPGETLEQCVEREIREEVGIKVKNIKYFSSQPWSFPDSLMMAFTAEYESGDITVDNCEITDAAWYKADNLPEIPSIDSVAGRMIRWYRDSHVNKTTELH